MVGFRTKMTEMKIAFDFRLIHRLTKFSTIEGVKTIPFYHCRIDILTTKNLLERALDGGGTCARRTSHGDYRMFLRHELPLNMPAS